jgi:glycosyltransferase involved in cell wall biosynthesis
MPELPKLPPIASKPLSVVLLAHDAGDALESVVAGWVEYLDGLGRDYELILVDDGSRDGTGERAEALAGKYPRLKVLRHAAARGEGAALRTALAVARHPLLFYALCDPRFQPADLGRLLHKSLDPRKPDPEIDHVHVLSGSRAGRRVPLAVRGVGVLWGLFCRVVFSHRPARLPGWLGWRAHAGRLLVRALLGVRYQDVACPFRLIRRDIFARIPLQSDGPFVHVEILAKANFLGHVLGGEEVKLGPGHHPPVDEPRPGGNFRQWTAEFRRLLSQPDFGPPPAPEPAPPEKEPAEKTDAESAAGLVAPTDGGPGPTP